jgi:hypothetical protein
MISLCDRLSACAVKSPTAVKNMHKQIFENKFVTHDDNFPLQFREKFPETIKRHEIYTF